MFRPVLNGRSIIQMIDPARDFRGMGRQVTRTGRHMRVMFSAESGADPRSSVARSGFRNDAFNYDFYAFHDIDTRLSSSPPLDSNGFSRLVFSNLLWIILRRRKWLFARVQLFRSGSSTTFFLPFSFFPLFLIRILLRYVAGYFIAGPTIAVNVVSVTGYRAPWPPAINYAN